MKIEIPLLSKLIARLSGAGLTAQQQLVQALTRSAIYMQGVARTEAPVRTGALRAGIGVRIDAATLQAQVYDDTVSEEGAPYPLYVHQGTGIYALDQSLTSGRLKNGGIHPNQFFQRTMDKSEVFVEEQFGQATRNVALYIGDL